MIHIPPRRTAVAVVLVLLAAGAAPARPASSARPPHAVAASAPLLPAVWDWLGSLVSQRAAPPATPAARRGMPPKAGCGMDPDGKAIPCPQR
ncbi:MAG TPA: hypothetical protein VIA62_11090 [Thermoanaerobaculia bacterium]|jgi:hypothetical protein|nr:hypothetical protein [Thermoanaerobaculia bacterium]